MKYSYILLEKCFILPVFTIMFTRDMQAEAARVHVQYTSPVAVGIKLIVYWLREGLVMVNWCGEWHT